jgi:transposase
MAFIRIEKKKSGSYIRIIESYRDQNNLVKHKTLYNLGKVEDYKPEQLQRIGKALIESATGNILDLKQHNIKEIARYNYGFPLIYNQILKLYNLDILFEKYFRHGNLKINILDCIKLMLVERLNDPVSKLSNFINQHDYLGLQTVELQHLYRSLDYLCENQEAIKLQIFNKYRNLFNNQFDVVFYDVTTFYFESSVEKEGHLRQKGFGKDGKIGNTQVVFGMLIDKNKHPVYYKLYNGKQYEGHTLTKALDELKVKFKIDKIIIVTDTGMMNKENIEFIENKTDYEYIIGERMKNLSGEKKSELINSENYTKSVKVIDRKGKEITIKYYQTTYKNKTLISTYSEKRAHKDKHEREEKIRKAYKLLENPSNIKTKAAHYYLKPFNKEQYVFDEVKIRQSEKYDGYFCIATNIKNPNISEILDNYKHLFQIEHGFRTMKSHLETRPVFHWTDRRIEGHICLCYIAYTLLTNLKLQLEKQGINLSENKIRKLISEMQLSLIQQGNEQYYLRSILNEEQLQILKVLKIKELPDMIHKPHISKYL